MEANPIQNKTPFTKFEALDHDKALSILESLFFSSDKPFGMSALRQVFGGTSFDDTKKIKKILEEFQSICLNSTRGVTLEEVNGGWQLRTKKANREFLKKLIKTRPFRLSGPALEVLSIVAYRQPIVKSEVDQIRGVESGHLMRALMERKLIQFRGKSDLPGKPMCYGTTGRFLEVFGLRNLRELPNLDEIHQLLPDGIGDKDDSKQEDLDAVYLGGMDDPGQYSNTQGEKELEKIEDAIKAVKTTSEFFEEEKKQSKEDKSSSEKI